MANSSVRRAAARAGVRVTLWNLDSLDWQSNRSTSIVTRVTKLAHNGSVVLMHDGEGGRPATVAALPGIIRKFRASGYDFVTLDEMAALGYRIP
jgi:peptidoglycan/xylan/chitin deacetylase (PgdA/CDA1 family)